MRRHSHEKFYMPERIYGLINCTTLITFIFFILSHNYNCILVRGVTESCVLYLALLNCLIPAMGTLLNGAAHVSFKLQKKKKKIWSTQCGSYVASKNKSIMSKSVSFTRLLKNERNMWAIKSSGDNGMSISVSIFICPFFVFFFFFCMR